MEGNRTMKIENEKAFKIVINGVELHQDDIYKMLATSYGIYIYNIKWETGVIKMK